MTISIPMTERIISVQSLLDTPMELRANDATTTSAPSTVDPT